MDFDQKKGREQRIKRDRRRRDSNRGQAPFDDSHQRNRDHRKDDTPKQTPNVSCSNAGKDEKKDYTAIPDPHMFDNLKRETDEIAAITSKKPVTRQVFSSWSPYTPPVEPSEEPRGTNYDTLLEGAQIGSHFQMKFENTWDTRKASKHTQIFDVNLEHLSHGVPCVPAYEKLQIPMDIFSGNEMDGMEQNARVNTTKYKPTSNTSLRCALKQEDSNESFLESLLGKDEDTVLIFSNMRFPVSSVAEESNLSTSIDFEIETPEVTYPVSPRRVISYRSSRSPSITLEETSAQLERRISELGDQFKSPPVMTKYGDISSELRLTRCESPEKDVPQESQVDIAETLPETIEPIQDEEKPISDLSKMYQSDLCSEVVDKDTEGKKRRGRKGKYKKRESELDVIESKLDSQAIVIQEPKEKENNQKLEVIKKDSPEPERNNSKSPELGVIPNPIPESKISKKYRPEPEVSRKDNTTELKTKGKSSPEPESSKPRTEPQKMYRQEIEKNKQTDQGSDIAKKSSGPVCETDSQKESKKKSIEMSQDTRKPRKLRERTDDLDFLLKLKIPEKKSSTILLKSSTATHNIDDDPTSCKSGTSFQLPIIETKTEDLEEWLDSILDS